MDTHGEAVSTSHIALLSSPWDSESSLEKESRNLIFSDRLEGASDTSEGSVPTPVAISFESVSAFWFLGRTLVGPV
jgi:hypothetical protein